MNSFADDLNSADVRASDLTNIIKWGIESSSPPFDDFESDGFGISKMLWDALNSVFELILQSFSLNVFHRFVVILYKWKFLRKFF